MLRNKNQDYINRSASLIKLSEPFSFRHSRLAVLSIDPVQANGRDFMVYDSLRIQITFNAHSLTSNVTTSFNGQSNYLKDFCLNAEQGQKWQSSFSQTIAKTSTRSAFSSWYKIPVDSSGFYIIDEHTLQAVGINTALAQPENIQIYNKGRQIAVDVHAPNNRIDSTFSAIFYGEALDNSFTKRNAYWLTLGQTQGVRIDSTNGMPFDNTMIRHYREHIVLKEQNFYAEKTELQERWYWKKFDRDSSEISIHFTTPHVLRSSSYTHELNIHFAGVYADSLINHQCEIVLNDSLRWDVTWQGNGMHDVNYSLDPEQLIQGENKLAIRKTSPDSVDQFYLDKIQLEFDNQLFMVDKPLKFKTTQSGVQHFSILGVKADSALLYNISNPMKPEKITFRSDFSGISFQDTLTLNSTLMVMHQKHLRHPQILSQSGSQLLLPTNQAEYLIITPRHFKDALVSFQKHKKSLGLKTKIVTLEEIYNDFNDGIPSVQAIKNFLSFAFYNWQKPAPYYCLLVGDATLDPRDYLNQNIASYHMPTYIHNTPDGLMQTADDYWFGCVTGTDNIPDYLIGRLPVHSVQELGSLLQKIIAYETQETADWQKNILYIADKADSIDYESQVNEFANNFLSARFLARKLFINNYGAAESRRRLLDKFDQGALVASFLGNGTKQNWSSDELFSVNDVNELQNADKLPLLLSFRTQNGVYYDPLVLQTLPEAMLTAPTGGAVASLMSSYAMNSETEKRMLAFVQRSMLLNYENHLGTVALKNIFHFLNNADFNEHSHGFALLGDPSLHLKMSGQNVGRPAHFSGTVRIENSSVRSGKTLSAWVKGKRINKSFTIQSDGRFGIFSICEDIPGTWEQEGCALGDTIQFRVVRVSGDTANLYPPAQWKPGEHQYLELFTYPTHVENAPTVTYHVDGRVAGIDYVPGDPIAASSTITCSIEFPTPAEEEIYLYRNGQKCAETDYQLKKISSTSYNITCAVNTLQDGEYELGIHTSHGRVQNATLQFKLESQLAIAELLNYPNPMQDHTHFSFILHNDQNATATINIYTLAGRPVKKLAQPVDVGFNQIFWDGRDDAGDRPANGVYLYRLLVTDGIEKCNKIEKVILAN